MGSKRSSTLFEGLPRGGTGSATAAFRLRDGMGFDARRRPDGETRGFGFRAQRGS